MLEKLFGDRTTRAQQSTFRVIIQYSNTGQWSAGSGFFISSTKFLTCFHVVFGKGLRGLREDATVRGIQKGNEHEKLQTYLQILNPSIRVYLHDGYQADATVESFSEKYDAVLLNVQMANRKVTVPRIEWSKTNSRGERIFFGGFPSHPSYRFDDSPFAVHEGIISCITKTQIEGDTYEHLQIDSINLGGNSGAPLFDVHGKKVIGIINGHHNWGNDYLLALPPGAVEPQKVSFRTPLSIAYATQLRIIKEESGLLLG